MVKKDILIALNSRKSELKDMLNDHSLQLERQHQIYGAINEIELLVKTLDYYETSEEGKRFGKVRLVKPNAPQQDKFSKILDDVKSKLKKK